jgi:glycosyltransferase involved in cell wall biosynthesis
MKIGYLLQSEEEIRKPPYNGPANHIRQVIFELKRQGHTVRLLFRKDGKIWVSDDLEDFRPLLVSGIDTGPLRWLERAIRRLQSGLKFPYLAFFESLRFAMACRQELNDYDLFLERVSWMGYGGALASKWLRIPLVLEYNGDPLDDLLVKNLVPKGVQLYISKFIMKSNLKAASHVVASGEGWRKNCVEKWGIAADRITTIENGTELVCLLKREQLKSFQSEDGSPLKIVYLGGFYPWHGVSILLSAFTDAQRNGVYAELVLIGSGAGESEARQLADSLGIADAVKFTGQLAISDYGPLLASADIGVSPYCGWAEFSGLKLFDYKAAGLATIASGKDGNPVTLKQGITGWIVPPCDQEALAEAICTLYFDPHLRIQMGRQSRLEAEKFHSWEFTVKQLEQVFKKALTA